MNGTNLIRDLRTVFLLSQDCVRFVNASSKMCKKPRLHILSPVGWDAWLTRQFILFKIIKTIPNTCTMDVEGEVWKQVYLENGYLVWNGGRRIRRNGWHTPLPKMFFPGAYKYNNTYYCTYWSNHHSSNVSSCSSTIAWH